MKRDFHPFYESNFLKRPPGNFCLNCGKRLVVNQRFNWNYIKFKPDHGKKFVIGYCHNYPCGDDDFLLEN